MGYTWVIEVEVHESTHERKKQLAARLAHLASRPPRRRCPGQCTPACTRACSATASWAGARSSSRSACGAGVRGAAGGSRRLTAVLSTGQRPRAHGSSLPGRPSSGAMSRPCGWRVGAGTHISPATRAISRDSHPGGPGVCRVSRHTRHTWVTRPRCRIAKQACNEYVPFDI